MEEFSTDGDKQDSMATRGAADASATNGSKGSTVGNVQIRCCFERDLGLFRILQATGKALASGGFGFSFPQQPKGNNRQASSASFETKADGDNDKKSNHTQTGGVHEYLFIEEVFFLHERGLLLCQEGESQTENSVYLDTSQLFQLLPQLHLSLPMYLVYAHLRSQDFRVLRHAPERLNLLKRQQEVRHLSLQDQENKGMLRQEARDLRHQVRSSIANGSPPSIYSSSANSGTGRLCIAWDVYLPNSNFAKTHPGPPDFYVAATYFNERHVPFAQLEELALTESNDIPVKLATVSDSGTVVMFGVTTVGVPSIKKTGT